MDNTILKKRLSTFRTTKGSITKVTDDVLYEVLRAWEEWPGTQKDFYISIGVSSKQMACIIGKAKKLKREGIFPAEDFKEIKIAESMLPYNSSPCSGIEISWDGGRLIRFNQVELLVDFLRKVS